MITPKSVPASADSTTSSNERLPAGQFAYRTIIDSFTARPVTLRSPSAPPLMALRLPKHAPYQLGHTPTSLSVNDKGYSTVEPPGIPTAVRQFGAYLAKEGYPRLRLRIAASMPRPSSPRFWRGEAGYRAQSAP